ncbi:hypothetical protein BCR33DRAFT_501523 [Rhizoclosmatium globosum]|uniref:Uncharacterized protein n=1 Tax=Rhizoclosmatium globosum TaxID=329046 RepID=A0A1Y2CVH9_9FUNG|nr:hypothetical protein BCR33DRAFT_501523 [Rhizoclosmatium globosum]|eukprot:ORY51032.1 hypothetical protein BCR33DRAFT_501523 [Rhizoclosmatium globosum]
MGKATVPAPSSVPSSSSTSDEPTATAQGEPALQINPDLQHLPTPASLLSNPLTPIQASAPTSLPSIMIPQSTPLFPTTLRPEAHQCFYSSSNSLSNIHNTSNLPYERQSYCNGKVKSKIQLVHNLFRIKGPVAALRFRILIFLQIIRSWISCYGRLRQQPRLRRMVKTDRHHLRMLIMTKMGTIKV